MKKLLGIDLRDQPSELLRGPSLKIVNNLSKIIVKDKAPVHVGARMGRPEKAKERKMSPYVPFPLEKIYDALNEAEDQNSAQNSWGGSNIIGGHVEAIINSTIKGG